MEHGSVIVMVPRQCTVFNLPKIEIRDASENTSVINRVTDSQITYRVSSTDRKHWQRTGYQTRTGSAVLSSLSLENMDYTTNKM